MTGRLFSGILLATAVLAQTPPSAESILADAKAQAQAGNRAIFTVFHASW